MQVFLIQNAIRGFGFDRLLGADMPPEVGGPRKLLLTNGTFGRILPAVAAVQRVLAVVCELLATRAALT